MENFASPSASSSRTEAVVIRSRSSPVGWSARRERAGGRVFSHTLVRTGFFTRSAADTMAHSLVSCGGTDGPAPYRVPGNRSRTVR